MQKWISSLSDKERKVFYVMVLIVCTALMDRLFLGPAMNKVAMLEQEISVQKESIEQDMRILARKDQIIERSDAFKKFYNDGARSSDDINANFLSTVTRLAEQASVNLVKSNPTDIKVEKKYKEYYANVDCVGSLENVVSFIHGLNSTDELFKVVRLNMSPKRGGQEDEVNASLTIVKMLINPTMNNVVEEVAP